MKAENLLEVKEKQTGLKWIATSHLFFLPLLNSFVAKRMQCWLPHLIITVVFEALKN